MILMNILIINMYYQNILLSRRSTRCPYWKYNDMLYFHTGIIITYSSRIILEEDYWKNNISQNNHRRSTRCPYWADASLRRPPLQRWPGATLRGHGYIEQLFCFLSLSLSLSLSLYVYIYIYICIHTYVDIHMYNVYAHTCSYMYIMYIYMVYLYMVYII